MDGDKDQGRGIREREGYPFLLLGLGTQNTFYNIKLNTGWSSSDPSGATLYHGAESAVLLSLYSK